MDQFICWKCSAALGKVILPMSRREECAQCSADQHVCLMCEFYQSGKGCSEERAETVRDIEKANFCDYFKPAKRPPVHASGDKAAQAKAQLAALFGDDSGQAPEKPQELSAKQIAEQKLRDLLGG